MFFTAICTATASPAARSAIKRGIALAHAGDSYAVVAVEYRLSPEHPYLTGLEDCSLARCNIAAEAGARRLEASRIVVARGSAGGLLAAATALMARDKSGPVLAGMICLYPNSDLQEESG
jgi:acetyl esterase/lipase